MGSTLYPSKARLTALELAERGIKTLVTVRKDVGSLLWTDKKTYLDLTEPITGRYRNPKDKFVIVIHLCLKHAKTWEPLKNEVIELTGRQSCIICKEKNPVNMTKALSMRSRYTEDLAAGHKDAAEYWRGQASAYFTGNPKTHTWKEVIAVDTGSKMYVCRKCGDWKQEGERSGPCYGKELFHYHESSKPGHAHLSGNREHTHGLGRAAWGWDKNPRKISIETVKCVRCGKSIATTSRSVLGLDTLKFKYGYICSDCATPSEKQHILEEIGKTIVNRNPLVKVSECPKCHRKMGEKHKIITNKPTVETMEKWARLGYAKATDGCRVEEDGICEHGHTSWIRVLGYI